MLSWPVNIQTDLLVPRVVNWDGSNADKWFRSLIRQFLDLKRAPLVKLLKLSLDITSSSELNNSLEL